MPVFDIEVVKVPGIHTLLLHYCDAFLVSFRIVRVNQSITDTPTIIDES